MEFSALRLEVWQAVEGSFIVLIDTPSRCEWVYLPSLVDLTRLLGELLPTVEAVQRLEAAERAEAKEAERRRRRWTA
jgi:hypothetical protein